MRRICEALVNNPEGHCNKKATYKEIFYDGDGEVYLCTQHARIYLRELPKIVPIEVKD